MNSRAKGKRGELELVEFLRGHGIEARRGQQYSGGVDSPDVVVPSLADFHFECKRVEAGNPYAWLAQATRDAKGKIPIVAHKRNHEDWIAVLSLGDFLRLVGNATHVKA
jgi:Holliday junction resolvase